LVQIVFHLKGFSLAIPRGSLFGGGGSGSGGVDDFYDLTNIPSILRVVPESTTYSGVILHLQHRLIDDRLFPLWFLPLE
jgi:hypothetical protein